jgi:hypothetical protein
MAEICQWSYICAYCQHSPFCFLPKLPKECGSFFTALAVRATVVRPSAYCSRHSAIYQWISGRVIAKSAGSGEPVFTSMDALQYCTDRIALRQAIFKRKKGFATISLGLIYHSMVLPQIPLPSHGTLIFVYFSVYDSFIFFY